MKYLIGFLLLILLVSCEKFSPVSEKTTKVIIKIDVPPDEIILAEDDPYDMNYDIKVVQKAKLDKNGIFTLAIPMKEPDFFQLKYENTILLEKVYLFPGDELKINVDNTNEDDIIIKFEGKSAKANNFVKNITSQFKRDEEYYKQLYNPNVEEFIKYADKRRQDMLQYYNDYFFKDSVPFIINRSEISRINFEWAYLRNEWAIRNYYYASDNWNKPVLPAGYFSFLNNLNIDEPYLNLFLSRYMESLLWNWHIEQVNNGIQPTAQSRELKRFEIAKQKFTGPTADIAMTLCINDLLVFTFDERMLEVIGNLMNDFKQLVKDKGYYQSVEKIYKKRLSLLKGNPAPDFTLPNLLNAPISLKDFKGKVVYCYFWSSLYAPSYQLLLKFRELQEKYRGNQNIILMTIDMEENGLDNWRRILEQEKLVGVHLYSEGLFMNKAATVYMINSIPFSLIVDKEGKIYTLNAPFPGNEKLSEILESLM